MALINSQGEEVADAWSYPDDQRNIAVRAYAVVPVTMLVELGSSFALQRPIGGLVSPDVPTDLFAPLLDRLDLIVIEFPKLREGRGFTTARALREKYGFKGDIRAIGHVLPDQFAALVQCGFSSIVAPADHPPEQWIASSTPASRGPGRGQLLNRLIGGRAVSVPRI